MYRNVKKIAILYLSDYNKSIKKWRCFILKGFLQRLGKSLMMPISIIAAAGIFLGIAAALQNPNIVGESFMNMEFAQNVIGFIRKLAGALFGNLPLLFAISLAIGMVDDEKPTAAFSGAIGFLVFHVTINYILGLKGITAETTAVKYLMENKSIDNIQASFINAQYETVLGIFTYRMNVFGGVISGLVVAMLHNKFYRIKLPDAINFFGGRRFVPIITTICVPIVGLVFYFIWPVIGNVIFQIGGFIEKSGAFGTFVFGFIERLLIPTGLHHILNQTVRFTAVGGTANINGEQVVGALNIFNTSLASKTPVSLDVVRMSTRFLAQGKIPVMMFGLVGAAVAMYQTANEKEKSRIKALMIAGASASFVTGITEPLEFSFIFVSPILFVFHAFMTGLSFFLMQILGVMIGNVQGGVIDLAVFGILKGMDTHWYFAVIVGIIYFFVYYFFFKFIILLRNIETPGREKEEVEGARVVISSDLNETAERIIEAVGGRENIKVIDNCFTRLRLTLEDVGKVNDADLKGTGAAGIVKPDKKNIQIIYGPKVEQIANSVKTAMNYKK